MENRNLLVIIAIILAGIFSILAVTYYQEGNRNPKSILEKVGDDLGEAIEEVGDEIDDNTKAR